MFARPEIAQGRYGRPSREIYDDLKDNDRLKDTVGSASLRILSSHSPPHVRAALVVCPLIYGRGRGPVKQRNIQSPKSRDVQYSSAMGSVLELARMRGVISTCTI